MKDPFKDIEMLSQPMMTEEGFINPACMNELQAWLDNTPAVHDDETRAKNDPEWNTPIWLFVHDITGYFACWAVRQLKHTAHPPNLEKLIGYLYACLQLEWEKLNAEHGMVQLTLCDVSRLLHSILMKDATFNEWNTQEGMGDDWLDLHAILCNVCISIRNEKREHNRFNAEFEKEHGKLKAEEF